MVKLTYMSSAIRMEMLMGTKNISPAERAALRKRAKKTRQQLEHTPSVSELLAAQERTDSAPFYFVLRAFIQQLKKARAKAGLTLAEVSHKTGIAVESLSRLETGAQTNPTWKTLGSYAAAVGLQPRLTADTATQGNKSD
jgi:DNA-binding XRE family transcriptional regulator